MDPSEHKDWPAIVAALLRKAGRRYMAHEVNVRAILPLLWSGGSGDSSAWVVRLPDEGGLRVIIPDAMEPDRPAADVLRERVEAYRHAARETEKVLALLGDR